MTIRSGLALALFGSACSAAPAAPAAPATVSLPAALRDGKVSVEKALEQRRSVRSLAATPLTLAEIGQLCWAAQGVTDDRGHRTAPSAHATYPLELYVVAGSVSDLPPGLYHYLPATHSLALVAAGDRREDLVGKAVGQGWAGKAPAIFVVSGAAEKMASMKDRGREFMWVEAGLAAQGFFLEATATGLGSTYVGGFEPAAAKSVLDLPAGEEVLAILPVGRKP